MFRFWLESEHKANDGSFPTHYRHALRENNIGFKGLLACTNNQRSNNIPIRIDSSENGFKFSIFFTLLDDRQIVAQRAQTRLEFLVVQKASLVFVEMSERVDEKKVREIKGLGQRIIMKDL